MESSLALSEKVVSNTMCDRLKDVLLIGVMNQIHSGLVASVPLLSLYLITVILRSNSLNMGANQSMSSSPCLVKRLM